MTVLHYLVGLLLEQEPEAAEFAGRHLQLFQDASKSIASFQSFFPKIIRKLYMLEIEDHNCPPQETEFKERLNTLRDTLLEECAVLNQKLHKIDHEIVFFGNYENTEPENMTVNAIKRLWIELKEIHMFPATECQQRAKRDEDRYMFFVTMEHFFLDMKKAKLYVEATRLKKAQQEAIKKRLEEEIASPRPQKSLSSKPIRVREKPSLPAVAESTSESPTSFNGPGSFGKKPGMIMVRTIPGNKRSSLGSSTDLIPNGSPQEFKSLDQLQRPVIARGTSDEIEKRLFSKLGDSLNSPRSIEPQLAPVQRTVNEVPKPPEPS